MTEDSTLPIAYGDIHTDIVQLLENARRTAARSVNALMTASYWEIGRRIVEFEQGGEERAGYRQQLLKRLSQDLTGKFGRGFSVDNLELMRLFYNTYSPERISETLSRKLPAADSDRKSETLSRILTIDQLAAAFPLSWSHYVHLMRSTRSGEEREFYETEALRCGWSIRQLNRQINSAFYTRILLSKNKSAMLEKGEQPQADDMVTPEQAIKDPFVLEFLNLKDQYSESDLEDALIQHLADFLLELGDDFTFVGRQRRLRLDDTWFRIDLLFFHRRLKCLVVIDLKIGKFGYADAGQMHLYLNYAREHWMKPGENPPVGLILCAAKGAAEAHYALDNLPNKVLAAEYQTVLPDEKLLAEELERSRIELEARRLAGSRSKGDV
jgi:predicted nuclease of restriction endonuclease-like (RecB) superfamily